MLEQIVAWLRVDPDVVRRVCDRNLPEHPTREEAASALARVFTEALTEGVSVEVRLERNGLRRAAEL